MKEDMGSRTEAVSRFSSIYKKTISVGPIHRTLLPLVLYPFSACCLYSFTWIFYSVWACNLPSCACFLVNVSWVIQLVVLFAVKDSASKSFRAYYQGFFQVLYHTTVFVFQIEFVKCQRPFVTPKTWRNQQGVCRVL